MEFCNDFNEYPDFEGRKALFPTLTQIDRVGQALQRKAAESPFGIQETRVIVWPNTTFLLQEEDTPEDPTITIDLQQLQGLVGKIITEAKVRLVVSPEQLTHTSGPKESEPKKAIESLESKAAEISNVIAEALGLSPEQMQRPVVEVAMAADTALSLEFDSKTKDGESIPETLRGYVAQKALYALYSSFNTKKEQAEVWIRQNRPRASVFISES